MTTHEFDHLSSEDTVLDSLPDAVIASLEIRDRWFGALPKGSNGEEFVVDELQKWAPGQRVRVAFNGGSKELHQRIADTVGGLAAHCNLTLDFEDEDGSFRSWSPEDEQHAAEIRVGFDLNGYFSLVGNDSADPNVGSPLDVVGGRAGQCSLNLGGFHVKLPSTWKGTVLHEFLHALAFHHEHTNMAGPCQSEFRWEDDPGYQPTLDSRGAYTNDAAGRRPGIYTYLAGYPNRWPRSKVDHNLRPSKSPVTAGPFDRASVMLYRFAPLFYRTANSSCAPSGDGQALSQGDVEGLKRLYPKAGEGFASFVERRLDLIDTLEGRKGTPVDVAGESVGGVNAPSVALNAASRLKASLAQLE